MRPLCPKLSVSLSTQLASQKRKEDAAAAAASAAGKNDMPVDRRKENKQGCSGAKNASEKLETGQMGPDLFFFFSETSSGTPATLCFCLGGAERRETERRKVHTTLGGMESGERNGSR